jgi:hypothetical protein
MTRHMTDGEHSLKSAVAAYSNMTKQPDTQDLSENVSCHAMGPYVTHEDGRMCGYHHRLDKWVCGDTQECLRDHPKHLRGM